jgi:hypothetical protein
MAPKKVGGKTWKMSEKWRQKSGRKNVEDEGKMEWNRDRSVATISGTKTKNWADVLVSK